MTADATPSAGDFGWQPDRDQAKAIGAWLRMSRQARRDALRAQMGGDEAGRERRGHRRGRGRGRGSRPPGGFPFGEFGPRDLGAAGFPAVRFPFGESPHGRRGPRRGRGDVRAAILALLAEEPMHGYQIIQEISERSVGMWTPSPGSVYPALQLLEDEGLIRFETGEGRRVVHLTDEGRRYVEENGDELERVWQPFSGSHTEGVVDLRSALTGIGMAAMQVYRAGSPSQIGRAREILATATRNLYAVLAEADLADDADEPSDERPDPDNS